LLRAIQNSLLEKSREKPVRQNSTTALGKALPRPMPMARAKSL